MDESDVYRQYLIKRYWEKKNENQLNRIIPYEDSYIDLKETPWTKSNEPKTEVSDYAVDRLIDRILINQTISLADRKDYYDDFESSPLANEATKIPNMYKVQSNAFSDYRLPKKRNGNKSSRRSRSRKPSNDDERFTDLPDGSEVTSKDCVPMVTLSVDMLRRYMYIEVEARVRYINEYYAKQWDDINKEKMASYAEMIIMKEKNEVLRAEMREMENMMTGFKEMCEQLEEKVEISKEARRRRKQAKKQRKSELPSSSQSDTMSSISASNTNTQHITDTQTGHDVDNQYATQSFHDSFDHRGDEEKDKLLSDADTRQQVMLVTARQLQDNNGYEIVNSAQILPRDLPDDTVADNKDKAELDEIHEN